MTKVSKLKQERRFSNVANVNNQFVQTALEILTWMKTLLCAPSACRFESLDLPHVRGAAGRYCLDP